MDREQHYLRALRWYSPAWRAAHGEAMAGDLMDQDDARGREVPSVLDRILLAVHGLRQRHPSGGVAVATAMSGLGLLLVVFDAFAPLELRPQWRIESPVGWLLTWRSAAVLLGTGVTGILLATIRQRRRAPLVTAAACGLVVWTAGAILTARWPYLGPRLVGGSDAWTWLPLGWTITSQWIFVPALTVIGATMLITAISAGVVGAAARRMGRTSRARA